MPTQIKKKQLKTEEFIQPEATADWTRDDITASAKAIAGMIRNAGTKKITANYKIWELDEGIYLVDGTKQANYRGGTFTLYQNYYLFVMNQSNSVPGTKKWIAVYETDNNGEDVHFIYGTCSSSSGYKAEKSLSEIRNMGGATANAAGSAGFAPAPAAGGNTKYLRGDATWQAIPNMTGATSSDAGNAGLVPAPSAGDEGKFLRGDGTWGENVKIYHATDEGLGVINVDATIEDIISEYQNGYYILLEDENGGRFPLYKVVNNPLHKEVCFGLTNLYDSFTKVNTYYYIGIYQSGTETWGVYTDSGSFPGGNPFGGASSSTSGSKGLVPAPAAGDEGKVLFGDGTWKNVGITLDGVAVGYTTAGYKYQFEYGGNPISYSEIVAKISNGIPVVANTNGPLWYLDRELINNSYEYVFKQVIVKNNQLQLRRLRHVVENNEDFWNEEIEFTTT